MENLPPLKKKENIKTEQRFDPKKVFTAFASLPKILYLVWAASPVLMIGMAVSTIVGGIVPLANAIIAGILLDSIIKAVFLHTLAPIWLPIILQLLVNLVDRTCSTLTSLFQTLLQERVTDHIQLMILRKANTLDLAFFENPEFHDKLRRASQEAANKPLMMISQTFNLVRAAITLFSMLGLLLHLAWWLVLIAMIIPIPSFIANSRYGFRSYWMMRWQGQEKRQQMYISTIMTYDTFNKEIKLFNLGDFFIGQYRLLAEKFFRANKGLEIPRSIAGLCWVALSVAANSCIYFYVALQAVFGRISIGALAQYTLAVTQAGQSFQGVMDGISNLYENHLFASTLFEFLEYEPAIVSPEHPVVLEAPPATKGLDIEFRNVSFTYPGKEEVTLKNVSFSMRAGETVALVGRNGSGKTTLVKLLTRLYDPDEGEIQVNGHNIKDYDLKDLREHIGVIFQDYVQYYMSVRENIGVGHIADITNDKLILRAAEKSGADMVVEQLPEKYETMLGRWFDKGTQLSGGEWQKVALARAFMRDANILILDEPTSALDARAEYEVFEDFHELTGGKTTIFISHRFSTARLADRILVIENGQILESGSHEELIKLNHRYAELFNLQAEAYR